MKSKVEAELIPLLAFISAYSKYCAWARLYLTSNPDHFLGFVHFGFEVWGSTSKMFCKEFSYPRKWLGEGRDLTPSEAKHWENKGVMYQGGKGHSQWQWCASVLLVAWKISPLKARCPSRFISASLRQILNTLWTLCDSWLRPTVTSDECNSCGSCWQLMEVGWPIALTLAPSCSL